jgi:hypothetical protein
MISRKFARRLERLEFVRRAETEVRCTVTASAAFESVKLGWRTLFFG